MKPTARRVSDVLSGLKPQVQSAPFSFEMVSVLFVDVWALPEPELELAPALQPTASRPAAMMTPYVVRRLMPFVLTAVSSVEHVREARPLSGSRRGERPKPMPRLASTELPLPRILLGQYPNYLSGTRLR